MERYRLEKIEKSILSLFARGNSSRLLTREIFETLVEFPNADLVRAFDDLEKSQRLIIRYTSDGHNWITLTPAGADHAGVSMIHDTPQPEALPHPPRSSP